MKCGLKLDPATVSHKINRKHTFVDKWLCIYNTEIGTVNNLIFWTKWGNQFLQSFLMFCLWATFWPNRIE